MEKRKIDEKKKKEIMPVKKMGKGKKEKKRRRLHEASNK
jgi:hypothetical protein